MNDFLEKLEIGENKIKLSKSEIKAILAEHGKSITTETEKVKAEFQKEKDEMKATIDDLKQQLENAPKSDELENLKTKIADYEQKESERQAKAKAEEQDKILTNNIIEAIGDKKFVNDYTKNSIINEIKQGLNDSKNAGKSAKDLFDSLTKDRTDIFENPNQISDIPPVQNDTGDGKTLNNANGGIKLNPIFRR